MNLRYLKIDDVLSRAGVPVIDGLHFDYTSREHGEGYVNHRPLGKKGNEEALAEVAYRLLYATADCPSFDFSKPTLVVGPKTLGAVLAETAVEQALLREPDLPMYWRKFDATIQPDESKVFFVSQEGSTIPAGLKIQQLIWMDDLMTKASTWKRTKALARQLAPEAKVAVVVITDRSGLDAATLGVEHFIYLKHVPMKSYPPDKCPFCEEGRPMVINLGHGEDFKKEKPDYHGGFCEI